MIASIIKEILGIFLRSLKRTICGSFTALNIRPTFGKPNEELALSLYLDFSKILVFITTTVILLHSSSTIIMYYFRQISSGSSQFQFSLREELSACSDE